MRFQIANLLREPGGEEIDFHNYRFRVPAVGSEHEEVAGDGPRVLSTHAPYQRQMKQVIYIVRDGRDVYVSFYHHLKRTLPPGTTFSEFLAQKQWPCRWSEHVNGWLDNARLNQLLLVRYEDMFTDGVEQLARVAEFAGLDRSRDQIADAVARSSFDRMKRTETEKGRYNSDEGPKNFVRKGVAGDWTTTFSPADIELFNDLERSGMDRMGYRLIASNQQAA